MAITVPAAIVVNACLGANADGRRIPGNVLMIHATYTHSDEYPTGGDALTEAMINTAITTAGFDAQIDTSTGLTKDITAVCNDQLHNSRFDVSASKVLNFVQSTGAQTANTTDLSAVSVDFWIIAPKSRS